jgi:glycoprotein endo-alpha-1,2-mannosidase
MIRLALVGVLIVFANAANSLAATVGAYYYPWYGPGAGGHHYEHVMRMHTTPDAQPPASIRNNILKHPRASELSYTIHYESTGRLGTFASPDYSKLVTDFRYLAQNVFSDPNYMRIDGRPVVVMYLSREYFRAQPGWDALANVRSVMQSEFGYDPYIVGDHFFNTIAPGAEHLDAVTAFDVYGQAFSGRATNIASLNRLASIYSSVERYAENVGVDFIPGLAPGYNDTAVRSGNAPSPRYLVDAAFGPTTQGSTMSEMLKRVVLPHTDPDINDLILVNSFNEWHEDTQIEPTIVAPSTTTDDTPSGTGYTAGYHYEGYGNLYLDLLRAATVIPGDFNRDGDVDDADFTVWRESFGNTGPNLPADGNRDTVINAADYTIWRDAQNLAGHAANGLNVPEPATAWLTALLLSAATCRLRRQTRHATFVHQVREA